VTGFIIIGAVGLALVVVSLLLGDIFDGLFEAFDVEFGGGIFSTPVLGSFLAAFGFGAALIMFSTGAGATLGALGGLVSGLFVGGLSLLMMRQLINMPTDASLDTEDLVGSTGTVITPIPENGLGEITVRAHGSAQKMSARAAQPIAVGTTVRITTVLSTSSVMVETAEHRP
jgi:membrane protein implicated in regulation of membrane protease activity